MTVELAERLRGANPVPGDEAVAADETLLARIVATPRNREERSWSRISGRRAVTLLAAAVIVIGGLAAAASRFAPQYFGSDDREPTPAAVLAELRRLASEEPVPGGLGEIEADGLVRLATFDTESGRATIYAAPLRASSGFCSVVGHGEEVGGGACSDGQDGKPIPYIGQGSSDWGDVHVLVGVLEAPAARIELRFEDGALRAASTRAPWWVYVVGGDETEPGHRPVELTALDPGGAVVAKQEVDPYFYTSRRAAEALLPESDGSPGQNAIHATVKRLGTGPWLEQGRVEIGRTRLLRGIETREGTLDIYTAPWGRGGVCYGYASSIPAFEPLITGCPADGAVPDQPISFERDLISVVRLAPSIFMVEGTPPLATARVYIRFEDGTRTNPDLFLTSSFVAWLGPDRLAPGRRATGLVALDADGRTIGTFRLDPEQFTSG